MKLFKSLREELNLFEAKTKKYKLGDKKGKLYQIVALVDIKGTSVKAGDTGGYVSSESNLSQEGSCWIYDSAVVSDNATVRHNAVIKDNAVVSDKGYIMNNAEVSGNAKVSQNGQVFANAVVTDNAKIYGSATITDNAEISQNAEIFGDLVIMRKLKIGGKIKISVGGVSSGIGSKLWKPEHVSNAKSSKTSFKTAGES